MEHHVSEKLSLESSTTHRLPSDGDEGTGWAAPKQFPQAAAIPFADTSQLLKNPDYAH
jgi:hypothetical protein